MTRALGRHVGWSSTEHGVSSAAGDASRLRRQRAGQQAGRFGDRSVGPGTRGGHRLGAFLFTDRDAKRPLIASAVPGARYRWVVLGVGTARRRPLRQRSSASPCSPRSFAPTSTSRSAETGVVLAAFGIGMTPTLLPWGLLTDRVGERIVLRSALRTSAVALACVGHCTGLRGARAAPRRRRRARRERQCGKRPGRDAVVRAVRAWPRARDPPGERADRRPRAPLSRCPQFADTPGFAGRSRPSAAGLPPRGDRGSDAPPRAEPARPRRPRGHTSSVASRPLRDAALWQISSGSALILVGQIATMSFTVLFLSEGRGFSTRTASRPQRCARARCLPGARRRPSDRARASLRSPRQQDRALCRSRSPSRRRSCSSPRPRGHRTGSSSRCSSWRVRSGCPGTASPSSPRRRSPAPAPAAPRSGSSRRFSGSRGIVAPIAFAALVSAASWRLGFLVAGLFPLLGWVVIRPLATSGRLEPRTG